ncbi:MLO-like protein 1 [Striga hermonthica]|uniref:MLO-like protein 1 n=1 Tax=Striga hermonthica TaxID=68872 RepID=A0A9N7NY69_STRHE|nr:MLO-like protein 1 [Striga hermonthica]
MAGGGSGEGASLEYTPTWIVALVCTIIVFAISLLAERILHFSGKYLLKKNQGSLYQALLKIKEELMLMGFISLMLAVFQTRIGKICIPKRWMNHWLPCSNYHDYNKAAKSTAHFEAFSRRLLAEAADGKSYCEAKGKAPLLSAEALHDLHIFIFVLAVTHVVFSALTFVFGGSKLWEIKLLMLETMLSSESGYRAPAKSVFSDGKEVAQRRTAVTGDLVVNPSDDHFWFHRPRLVLVLIHVILFQNVFEIAIFFWMLVMFGFDSCIMGKIGFIVPRLVIGYSTLPLYAIVAQMGSSFNSAIFEDHIQESLAGWVKKAKRDKGPKKAVGAVSNYHDSPSPQRVEMKEIQVKVDTKEQKGKEPEIEPSV